MFTDLLREASMPNEYYLPDKDGKIKAFEEAFGDDEIKKAIAYGFSSSHEYNTPEKKIKAVKSCIKFVNNYDWKEKELSVDKIESFNKPLNMKKVFDIAKSIEEKGNITPLIVVNKIHGFNWQSKGKAILTDGNHRFGAIKMLDLKTTPTYYGVYKGTAERDHEEFIPDSNENENVVNENYIPDDIFKNVTRIKDFFIESTNEYKMLKKGILNRIQIQESQSFLFEGTIEKVSLTPSEREAVKEKYGKVECSFFKNAKNGKYFCCTHRARSKFYDSPTEIPVDEVRFISSTA